MRYRNYSSSRCHLVWYGVSRCASTSKFALFSPSFFGFREQMYSIAIDKMLIWSRLIAVAILHITFLQSITSTNLNLVLVPSLVCEQIELGYSLLSATIPNLKSFVMSFDTAMMMDIGHKLRSQPNSHTDLCNRLGSSSDRAPRLSDLECGDTFISQLRPETGLRHIASIQHLQDWTDDGSLGNFERDSQDRMIRRDVRWTIEESRI